MGERVDDVVYQAFVERRQSRRTGASDGPSARACDPIEIRFDHTSRGQSGFRVRATRLHPSAAMTLDSTRSQEGWHGADQHEQDDQHWRSDKEADEEQHRQSGNDGDNR
jgi:hypothetical protein